MEFPEFPSRFSLVIYFIHSISCVYMSIPISQFLAPLSFPPRYPYVCSLHLCLYFYFANKIIYITLKIILFIYLGLAGSSLLSRLPSSCGGFSCCEPQAPGHMGFSSCTSSRPPEHRLNSCGSRRGCSVACGISPDQRSNPCLLHWQADSLPLSHQGSPYLYHFYRFHIYALIYCICFSLSDLLHSVSHRLSRFIHVSTNDLILFLSMADYDSTADIFNYCLPTNVP